MKKKLVYLLLTLCMVLAIFSFVACEKEKATPVNNGATVEKLSGTELFAEGFSYHEGTSSYHLTVPNATEAFDFNKAISVAKESSFLVSKDEYGENVIITKTISLSPGDNVRYVLVVDNKENIQAYKFVIRRKPMYTVAFNTENGSRVESQLIEEGATAASPSAPTRVGYTFLSWAYDFSQPITGNVTVNANWKVNNYLLTFNANGVANPDDKDVTYGDVYGTLPQPTREGYSFLGWFTQIEGGAKILETTKITTASEHTLYAQWKPDVIYTLNKDGASYSVTGYNGKNDIVILAEFNDLPVTSVLSKAFYENASLLSVTVNAKNIESEAFFLCSALKSVTLGKSVERVGEKAFNACHSLEEVHIPQNRKLTTLETGAFGSCDKLGSVNLSGCTALKTLEASCFSSCSTLASIVLPHSLERLERNAFYSCKALETIDLPDGLQYVGEMCFFSCNNLAYTVSHGGYYLGNKTNPYLFLNAVAQNDSTFTVQEGCRFLSSSCFEGYNKVTEIILPDGLTFIGSNAFNNCKNLAELSIPATVTHFGYNAFSSCAKLTAIDYLGTLEQWLQLDFGELNNLETSNPLHGNYAGTGGKRLFIQGTELTEVTFTTGEIKAYAFMDCPSLQKVTITSGVPLGKNAFKNCQNLTTVSVDSPTVSEFAFSGCSQLKNLEMGNSVRAIEKYAFSYCSKLSNIVVGDGVQSIGECAFYDIATSKTVTIGLSVEYIDAGVFSHSLLNSHYGKVVSLTFKNAENWYHTNSEQNLIDKVGGEPIDVTDPEANAEFLYDPNFLGGFYNTCHYVQTEYVAPTCCLNGYVKYSCTCSKGTHEKEFTLSKTGSILYNFCTVCGRAFCSEGVILTLNEDGASYSVSGLEDTFDPHVIIADSFNDLPITAIAYSAFFAQAIIDICIGKNVTSIGQVAFYRCKYLTTVTIGSGVNDIGAGAFSECFSLMEIIVNESNATYQSIDGDLYSKDGKTLIRCAPGTTRNSFSIPQSVTCIKSGAFEYSSIQELTIPTSVTYIEAGAFWSTRINNVIFENPNGWWYEEYQNERHPIEPHELTDFLFFAPDVSIRTDEG